jgi:Tfp pilus assembly protein PilF
VIDVSTVLSKYPRQAFDLRRNADHSLKKGDTAKAIAQLEQAVRIAPDFYQAHMDLGKLYKSSGRVDEAVREFETAVRLNKSSAEPLVALGEIYLSREQTERAIEVGEEAVKKDSGSPGAFLNLGLALYRSSQLDRAEVAFKQVLNLAPNATQVRLLLANVYLRQQNWAMVRKQLDTYLAENPNAPEQAEVEKIRRGLPPTAWRGKN